jgi:hypothetical protein
VLSAAVNSAGINLRPKFAWSDIKMSGPIVRKYGFPNFDRIFGERPLQHGSDDTEEPEAQPAKAKSSKGKARPSTKTRGSRVKKPK